MRRGITREAERTALLKQRAADIAELPSDSPWKPYISDDLLN